MTRYAITTKSGRDLGEVDASNPEEAIMVAYAAMGMQDEPVALFDDQCAHPAIKEFATLADALKVFTPDAVAYIDEV